jgi:hypothetical protein
MRRLFGVYNTKIESSKSIPIMLATAANPEYWVDAYGIDLAGVLLPGDYVEAWGGAEFTNNTVETGIVTCLTLTNAMPDQAGPLSVSNGYTGMFLCPQTVEDADKSIIHHQVRTPIGATLITDTTYSDLACFRMRCAAQSSAAMSTAIPIIIEQGYGQMWVKVYR